MITEFSFKHDRKKLVIDSLELFQQTHTIQYKSKYFTIHKNPL